MREKGQVLLIVLLVMTVTLTVGLSLATRTILNIRIVKQEEQSQRAFSAAEAGIEETLHSCTTTACNPATAPVGGFTQNNTTFSVVVNAPTGTSILVNGGNQILQDDGAQVWLSTYGSSSGTYTGALSVYWGGSSDTCPSAPAMEIITLSGSKTSPTLTRYSADPCTARRSANNFQAAQTGAFNINNTLFSYRFDIPIITGGLMVRFIPLYQSSAAALAAGSVLPMQGFEITSTGTTLDQGTPITRKIKVFSSYPQLPGSLFNYTLFSGGSAALSQ